MDRRQLEEALAAVDKCLSTSCDVVVVGGAAMILCFGASRATRDIDFLPLRGDLGELRRAIDQVAHEYCLPSDWMGDAVKGFADILPRDFYHRLSPLDLPLRSLHVYMLGLPDLVAMKVVSLREQDLEDLELLLPRMSEVDKRTLTDIMNQLAGVRPDWAQKIQYFLLEKGWLRQ